MEICYNCRWRQGMREKAMMALGFGKREKGKKDCGVGVKLWYERIGYGGD